MITNGIVYKITNKATKKEYIGITTNFKERMNLHKRANSKYQYLHKSIKKYGWDEFEVIKLHENVNLKDLEWLERHCISIFSTMVPNGYNLRYGGNHGLDSEDTKQRKSKSLIKFYETNKAKLRNPRKDVWDQKKDIIQEYKSGSTLKAIGREYNCSDHTIKNILQKEGIQLRKQKSDAWSKSEEIINQYKDGYALAFLGKKYNCSHMTIKKILLRSGVELKPKKYYQCKSFK